MKGSMTSTTLDEEPGFNAHTYAPSKSRSMLRSHSPSRRASSALSKTYKAASTLYLTRRLPEAFQAITPLISNSTGGDGNPTSTSEDEEGATTHAQPPPIAHANRSLRVKVWNFYLTLLNAIIELGPEDGKNEFGSTVWRSIVSRVRDGSVWDQVVDDGYGGNEGAVDADVVANLSTLLLAQSPMQIKNQERLETYLSFGGGSELALAADRLSGFDAAAAQGVGGVGLKRVSSQASGTNTPRELNSRAKVLELYTLHVLPRNEEWEAARDFIRMSNELDEERRDAFLYTLDTLQEQARTDADHEADLLRQRDEEMSRQRQEAEAKRLEDSRLLDEENARAASEAASQAASQRSAGSSRGASSTLGHRKSNSEVDYGIEETPAPRTTRMKKDSGGSTHATRSKGSQAGASKAVSRNQGRSSGRRQSSRKATVFQRLPALFGIMQRMFTNMAQAVAKDPMLLMRNLLFLLAFIIAFARRDVRERLGRITGLGWDKIKGTVGMGTKVSYI